MRNYAADTWAPWPAQPLATTKQQHTGGPQLRILYSWTINDHSMNELSLGYNRFSDSNGITPDAKYTAAMGIPGIPDTCFPTMNFSSSDQIKFLTHIGVGCSQRNPVESYIYQDTFSTTHGKHSFKFGGQYLHYRSNDWGPGPLSGNFNFSNIETALPGFQNSTGHPFASWLLGAADAGSGSSLQQRAGLSCRCVRLLWPGRLAHYLEAHSEPRPALGNSGAQVGSS